MPREYTPATDCTNQARPAIALEPVTSNQVQAIGYDAATKTLAVQFTRGNSIYHYPDVEPEQHAAFKGAESIGKHFGIHIAQLPSLKFGPDPVAESQDAEQAQA